MIESLKRARPQHIMRGIALIMATMFLTSVQDVVFKLFSSDLTLWQIFALRGMLALPLLFALARMQGMHGVVLSLALQKWPLIRAFFVTLLFLAFYGAIPFISLSTLGAANYIAPIVVALLSACLIGEPVGRRGWIAVFAGFAGVLVLLQPGTDAFSPWALLPLAGAGFYAFAHVITRSKCQGVPVVAMALSMALVMTSAGLVASALLMLWQPDEALVRAYPYLFAEWSEVGASQWLILGLLAIFAVIISMGLAGAYQSAPPSIVATFEYSYLVYVAIWDLLLFDLLPTFATVTGMLLIVGAGMMVSRRG